jgi:hypothetical protein
MKLSGLHLLLTYQCTLECDHCFAWGSPWQSGTMTLENIQQILRQAQDLGTIDSIYFEGGEPFLYYALLLGGVREAARLGFRVGVVSNGYWATSAADALEWLRPLAGLLQDLSISSDRYHWSEALSRQARNVRAAAKQLGIPIGIISIAQPEVNTASTTGQLPPGESAVMYRGRAVEKLAARAAQRPWEQFTACPYEDLREPGRVHIDPLGNVHLCEGIVVGNVFRTPLKRICAAYDPDRHPITGPLLEGGPAGLVLSYALPHASQYADACHPCYQARRILRGRFPEVLGPDQMYGVFTSPT